MSMIFKLFSTNVDAQLQPSCRFGLTIMRYVSVSLVAVRWSRLVRGWVTVCGRVNRLDCNQPLRSTQPGRPFVSWVGANRK